MYQHDKESAQESYRMKKNPPKFAAGQDDDLYAPPSEDERPLDGSQFDSYINGNSGPLVQQNQPAHQPQQSQMSLEEKMVDGIFEVSKFSLVGIARFLPDLFQTIKQTTPQGWLRTWNLFRNYGVVLTGVGIVVFVLNFVLRGFNLPLWLAYLGVLMATMGTVMSIVWNDKAKRWIDEEQMQGTTYDDLKPLNDTNGQEVLEGDFNVENEQEENDLNEETEEEFPQPVETDEEKQEYIDFSQAFGGAEFEDLTSDSQAEVNTDQAIAELENMTPEMASRTYLFESFYKVLRSVNPTYSKMEKIHDDSEKFAHFNYLLVSSAAQQGYSEDDYELLEVYENSLMYKMVIQTNSTKFKGEKVGPSIESLEKYDNLGREVNPNLFVTVKTIGSVVHIDIIKSNSPMVTLRDLFISNRDWYTEPSVEMPVALGMTEYGDTIRLDFQKTHSVILAGKPGMGKTWMAELILTQLCMFSSPKDVNLIIADIKGDQGDFSHFNVPHVIEKAQSGEEMMNLLRRIVSEEIPRRRAILSQYGLTDISDLKRNHPEVVMPYLYILIEEMIVLGDYIQSQGNEVKKEYRSILSEIVNVSRYIGIRFFGLSQRFTDDTLPKNVKLNIGLRMVVGAEPSVIEEITETKPKDFKYNIASKKGKYALATPGHNGGRTSLMIGAVITPSNPENQQVYNYMKAIWERLESSQA